MSQSAAAEGSSPLPQLTGARDLTLRRPALPALTGIRFFAAFYVVLFHSRLPLLLQSHHAHWAANFLGNGALAVVLFFLLSGMILSYTYQGQIETRSRVRRFYEARFARVWPLYVVSLVLSSLLDHTTPPPGTALATIGMVQAWNPWDTSMAGAWNFVCWTLSAEALFYLVFPFAQRWLEHRSAQVQAGVLAALLVLSVSLRTSLHGFSSGPQWLHVPLALIHVPEFLIGVCLGNLLLRQSAANRSLPYSRFPGLWTTVAALATGACLCSSEEWITALCAVGFAALLYGLAAESSPLRWLLSTRLLLLCGQISYGVYLLQWPVKAAANLLSVHLRFPVGATFPLYLVLLLAVSAAGFFGVEEPARKLLRTGFLHWEQARRRAPELSRG